MSGAKSRRFMMWVIWVRPTPPSRARVVSTTSFLVAIARHGHASSSHRYR